LAWEGTGSRLDGAWDTWPLGCVADLEIAPDGSVWSLCAGTLQRFAGGWEPRGDVTEGAVDFAFTASGDLVAADWWGDALWVGSESPDGTLRWEQGPQGIVFDVAAAPDGSVWAGMGDVLVRYADGSWTEIAGTEGWQIAMDPDGVAWSVGPESGLWRWSDPPVSFDEHRGAEDVWVAPNGDVWLRDEGLTRIGDRAEHLRGYSIVDVAFGPDGSVWAVSGFAGAFRFDGTGWARYTIDDGLSSNALTAVVVADDGVVWIGSRVEGVMRFTPSG
ncbi:MAG TPA: hypothetical protein VLD62_01000, partial [Acidimicrobiia bacterium]|nr:hypothetical protein [Acidimicrobiia bacterium]